VNKPWQQALFDKLANCEVYVRYAQGNFNLLDDFAQELLALQPQVVVAIDTPSTQAIVKAKRKSKREDPWVITAVCADPQQIKDEATANAPVIDAAPKVFGRIDHKKADAVRKPLGILSNYLDKLGRLAGHDDLIVLLCNESNEGKNLARNRILASAAAFPNLDVRAVSVRKPQYDWNQAFDEVRRLKQREDLKGVILVEDPQVGEASPQIVRFLHEERIPNLMETVQWVTPPGPTGLACWGPDRVEMFSWVGDQALKVIDTDKQPTTTRWQEPPQVLSVSQTSAAHYFHGFDEAYLVPDTLDNEPVIKLP
jgi:hypothetical protein